jgi:Protein kinase domain
LLVLLKKIQAVKLFFLISPFTISSSMTAPTTLILLRGGVAAKSRGQGMMTRFLSTTWSKNHKNHRSLPPPPPPLLVVPPPLVLIPAAALILTLLTTPASGSLSQEHDHDKEKGYNTLDTRAWTRRMRRLFSLDALLLALREDDSNPYSTRPTLTQCDLAHAQEQQPQQPPQKQPQPNIPFIMKTRATIRIEESSTRGEAMESRYDIDWNTPPLGEGAFGTVHLATERGTGEKVAVKKISKQFTTHDCFQREMDALLQIRDAGGHPNICALREYFDFVKEQCYALILDFIGGGEMFDHLVDNGAYSEADAARLIREVASAVAFLHGIDVVHADLKPEVSGWMDG